MGTEEVRSPAQTAVGLVSRRTVRRRARGSGDPAVCVTEFETMSRIRARKLSERPGRAPYPLALSDNRCSLGTAPHCGAVHGGPLGAASTRIHLAHCRVRGRSVGSVSRGLAAALEG